MAEPRRCTAYGNLYAEDGRLRHSRCFRRRSGEDGGAVAGSCAGLCDRRFVGEGALSAASPDVSRTRRWVAWPWSSCLGCRALNVPRSALRAMASFLRVRRAHRTSLVRRIHSAFGSTSAGWSRAGSPPPRECPRQTIDGAGAVGVGGRRLRGFRAVASVDRLGGLAPRRAI